MFLKFDLILKNLQNHLNLMFLKYLMFLKFDLILKNPQNRLNLMYH
jgi:hypothetical protein